MKQLLCHLKALWLIWKHDLHVFQNVKPPVLFVSFTILDSVMSKYLVSSMYPITETAAKPFLINILY